MKEIIQDAIFSVIDHGLEASLPLLPEGSTIQNVQLNLSNKRTIEIDQILKNGPVVLVFIRGTWCPFCRMHLGRLRNWVERLKHRKATIIVVSSESVEKINLWLAENPVTYLFASDEELLLSNYFGVHIDPNDYANAATFLIDSNRTIRVAYKGRRNQKNFTAIEHGF